MSEQMKLSGVSRSYSRIGRAATFALLLSIGRQSRADVQTCVDAHSTGQREVKAGHLNRASELFAACGALEDCPDPIRVECIEFHRETERNIPTVIFGVVDEYGRDRTDVRVFAAERLLSDGLNGRALRLDPGKYTFRFELPHGVSLDREVLVREGEKNRLVSVRVPAKGLTLAQSASPVSQTTATARSTLPTGFWISVGVGAAALVSWGAFALAGQAHQSKLDDCSPGCNADRRSDFDAMRRDYLIADISLGAAVASAGLATWFVLSHRDANTARAKAPTPSLKIVPSASKHGAGLFITAYSF